MPLVGPKLPSHETPWQICEDGLLSPAKKEGQGSGEPCSLTSSLLLHHLCRHWQVPQGISPGSSAIRQSPEDAPSHLRCSPLLKSPRAPVPRVAHCTTAAAPGRPGTPGLAGVNYWVGSNGDQLPTEGGGVEAKHE